MKTLVTLIVGALFATIALTVDLPALLSVNSVQADAALYAPRNWDSVRPSSLNISVFAFSDRNRNGRFDLGDKPMNRLAVRLTRPDASTRIKRSNINGYTNFGMQLDGTKADISASDQAYEFTALPPPGWTITTGNAVQTTDFKRVPGSITGLGANSPPSPVGLAPAATISRFAATPDGQSMRVENVQFGAAKVTRTPEGGLQAFVEPGVWTVTQPGEQPRRVVLSYAPVVLGSAIAPSATPGTAGEKRIVDFEDIRRSSIEKLPGGYAGLNWDYLLAVNNQFYKGPGYVNGLMSGARVAYNSSGHPVTVRAVTDHGRFDFVGGYFSVAWHNAEGETLIVRAWRDDELLAEDRFALSHLTPQYFQADYQDISRLEFSTLHYWQFVVDDLEFGLK